VIDEINGTIVFVSVARTLEALSATRGRPILESEVEPTTLAHYQRGLTIPGVAYATAIATCHQVGQAMARFHEDCDVLLSPTLAKPPVAFGILSLSARSVDAFREEVAAFTPFTRLQKHNRTARDVGAA